MTFSVSWIAVIVSALLPFALGMAWYGPLFGKAWRGEVGLSDERIKGANMPTIMGLSLVLNVVVAVIFGGLLGPAPSLGGAVRLALIVGVGFVATTFATTYLFSQKSMQLFVIDAGYNALRFLLIGLAFGLIP
ncbi:MAG: DUF1761 domain-containing protein [Alphaproteobacteria bacterium]